MGKYITKGVNTYLIVVIIVALVAIVAFSVYYQQIYGTAKEGFSTCSIDLESCQRGLDVATTNSTTLDLEVRKYNTLYENQSQELGSTKDKLSNTENSLASVQSQLAAANSQILGLRVTISELNTTIGQLRVNLTNLQNSLNSCNSQLNTCLNIT